MKTLATFQAGELRVIIRGDRGVYVGRPDKYGMFHRDMVRIGSSAVICDALADALKEAAGFMRGGDSEA